MIESNNKNSNNKDYSIATNITKKPIINKKQKTQ